MSQPTNPMTLHSTWDMVAADYEAEIEPQFEYFANCALERAAVHSAARIVDVACGPGTLAFRAACVGAQVSALDFSPAMIEKLNTRAAREAKGIEALVGDGMSLPWPDRSFDAGFSMFGLMFFSDRHKGFTELARVLKPGARAVVSSWVPVERVPLLADVYGTLGKLVPGLPAGARLPLTSLEECEREMLDGGFCDVRVGECGYELDVESVEAFWNTVQRSTPPVRLVREKVGPASWSAISSQVLETLTAKWGAGPQRLPMIANLIVGSAK